MVSIQFRDECIVLAPGLNPTLCQILSPLRTRSPIHLGGIRSKSPYDPTIPDTLAPPFANLEPSERFSPL